MIRSIFTNHLETSWMRINLQIAAIGLISVEAERRTTFPVETSRNPHKFWAADINNAFKWAADATGACMESSVSSANTWTVLYVRLGDVSILSAACAFLSCTLFLSARVLGCSAACWNLYVVIEQVCDSAGMRCISVHNNMKPCNTDAVCHGAVSPLRKTTIVSQELCGIRWPRDKKVRFPEVKLF